MKVVTKPLAKGETRPATTLAPATFIPEFNPNAEYRCADHQCDTGVTLDSADDLVVTQHQDYGGDTTCYVCWVCPSCGNHNDVLNLGYYELQGPNGFIERIQAKYAGVRLNIPEAALRAAFARYQH